MNKSSNFQEELDFTAEGTSFDLKGFLFRYLKYWYWFVLSLTLTIGLAWLYLRYTVPEYEAFSTLLIKDGKTDRAMSEEAIFQDLGILNSTNNLINEIEILKSRSLMAEVVGNLELSISYYAQGRLKESELYKETPIKIDTIIGNRQSLIGQRYTLQPLEGLQFKLLKGETELGEYQYGEWVIVDSTSIRISKTLANSKITTPIAIQFNNPFGLAQSFSGRLNVGPVKERSSVLQLRIRDEVPQKARDILNELVRVYNLATVRDKNKVSLNTFDFIKERLGILELELSEVEIAVERYKRNNEIPIELEANASLFLQRVTAYENQLAELEIQKSILTAIEGLINDIEKPFALLPISITTENSADLISKIDQHNQMILQRDNMLPSAGAENLNLRALESQITGLRQNILASIQQQKRNLDLSIKQAETKYKSLQSSIRSVPRKERELLEQRREQTIKQNLYLYLLQKREETALSLAVAVPNSRVIDSAVSGRSPISPKPFNSYAIGLFFGLSFPIGLLFLKELLNDKITTEQDIKRATATPIIGGIGFSRKESQIVVSKSSRSGVAEMFRLLRTNLQFLVQQDQTRILVTSGSSGEGKTFISVNLGMSMAISDKRTVIVGLDLRKPKLGAYLGTEDNIKGVTSYLVGNENIPSIIQQSQAHDNLSFITSGPIPPNPAELLLNDKLDQLFEYLANTFDIIIIDTPPIGLVADAYLLNRFATNSLFVLRYGKTQKVILPWLEETFNSNKLNKLGIVFNGIKSSGGYGYGAYGAYGYGYGYGYGYYEEEKEEGKKWFSRKK